MIKTLLYYDLTEKRKYIKNISDKLEDILLDNIVQTGGTNLTQPYMTLLEGRGIIQLLNKVYLRMKEFQYKLDELLKVIKPTEELSAKLQGKFSPIQEIRKKYDNIINDLNKIVNDKFIANSPQADLNKDMYLFIKSERAKWENILGIYINYINKYKEVMERIKGKKFDTIMVTINEQIDFNRKELLGFIDDLTKLFLYLQNVVVSIYNVADIKYERSDIVLANPREVPKLEKLSERNIYATKLKFSDLTSIVQPGNIDILESVFSTTVNELKGINLDDIDMTMPSLIRPRMVKQFGGQPIYDTISSLNEFGLMLQKTNEILGNIRKYYYSYIQLRIRLNYFVIYLMLIQQASNKEEVSYYNYLNYLIINHYYKIMQDIDRRMTIGDNLDDNSIRYFSTYHYFTIKRLLPFCQFLMSEIDANSIISVNSCKGKVKDSFVIFNHFTNILDKFDKSSY